MMMVQDEKMTERELDAAVAEKVMGYKVSPWSLHTVMSKADLSGRYWRHGVGSMSALKEQRFPTEVWFADNEGDMAGYEMDGGHGWESIPPYSTDISAAMCLLEQFACDYHIEKMAHLEEGVRYRVAVMKLPHKHSSRHDHAEAEASTLPLAI